MIKLKVENLHPILFEFLKGGPTSEKSLCEVVEIF